MYHHLERALLRPDPCVMGYRNDMENGWFA
jgi:hypothetical protein